MTPPWWPTVRAMQARQRGAKDQGMPDTDVIVIEIGKHFRTFGGGRDSADNPVAHALKDEPLQFAAGVDVQEVVLFVLGAVGAQIETRGR
jgi:hypothetical protein